MPIVLSLVLGVLLALLGGAFAVLAVLGGRGQLRRNRLVGVRTGATLRSDAAFEAANRAAAVPLAAAAGLAVLGGVVLVVGPFAGGTAVLAWVVLGVCLVGALVFAGLGGLVGDRAAAAVPEPEPEPALCGGACSGCSLVEGCGPAALKA